MKVETHEIEILNNSFELHPSGAIYWKDTQQLFIADLHIGKVSHFRKSGLAVPQEAVATNFRKLDEVVNFFQPESIYFLGDLFHSYKNNEWNFLEIWLNTQLASCHLIIGNHDIHDIKNFPEVNFLVHEKLESTQFIFTHEPQESPIKFNFCGHVHPGIVLRGAGLQREKTPCFAQYNNQLILPPFGEFTGLHSINLQECRHVYVTFGSKVAQLK